MLKPVLVFALLSMTSLAQAKDVSAQQIGVEYARGNLDKAEADYADSLQHVTDSEKRLTDARNHLADDRRKAAESKKSLEEARAKYARAQELLDQAWKKP